MTPRPYHLTRIYQNGGGPRPNRSAQRRGPLRKILWRITQPHNMFDTPLVRLECGHDEFSNGMFSARCGDCHRIATKTATTPEVTSEVKRAK